MINRMRKSSYGSGASSKPTKPTSTAFYEELFNKFKDSDEASIGPDGMERLCEAMEVDPADVLMLVFAWCLGASQMGYFSREEWLSAVGKVGDVTSEAELKGRVEEIHKSSLREPEALRELHQFAHKFCREERKKNIDVRPHTPHAPRHGHRCLHPNPDPDPNPNPDPDPDPDPDPRPRPGPGFNTDPGPNPDPDPDSDPDPTPAPDPDSDPKP